MAAIDQSGGVDIEARGSVPLLEPRSGALTSPKRSAIGGRVKRAADVTAALVAIVLFLPLLVFVALAIRATSDGPVFFGHERIGFGGRRFRCWKFRTMCLDADRVLREHLAADPALAREWKETRKLRHDPRVTRLGRVLREYSVDELPQLFNVLMGDMSLVGPRPVVDEELTRYGPHAAHYLSARPGITGLWQVSGRSDTTFRERVALDSQYALGWSFAGDLRIMVRTVPAVVGTRGAY